MTTITLYHASDANFAAFDFGRLGSNTAGNCTDGRAMELARLGVWLSDRPVASDIMSLYSYTVELDLGGFEIVDVDFDDLWAGADVSNADVIRVHDTELGCTSYVVTERASLAMTITRVDRVR